MQRYRLSDIKLDDMIPFVTNDLRSAMHKMPCSGKQFSSRIVFSVRPANFLGIGPGCMAMSVDTVILA